MPCPGYTGKLKLMAAKEKKIIGKSIPQEKIYTMLV